MKILVKTLLFRILSRGSNILNNKKEKKTFSFKINTFLCQIITKDNGKIHAFKFCAKVADFCIKSKKCKAKGEASKKVNILLSKLKKQLFVREEKSIL